MTTSDLHHLIELRSLIESFGARHAAARAAEDSAQLARLREILRKLNVALRRRDYTAFRVADANLHETVMEAANIPFLREVWQIVWNGLLELHQSGFEKHTPDPRVLMGEHEHLVDTIALGDPAAAEDAARCHVEANLSRLSLNAVSATAQNTGAFHRAAAHVAFHLHCPLRLTEIAENVAFTSPGNLSRQFREHYGLSFREYVQRMRLDKAAELLRTTRLPIATIARRVGYRDVSRFCLYYKRYFGMSPRTWRKKGGKAKHPTTPVARP